MAAKFGDVCVSTGEYQGKKQWLKIGVAFQRDNGGIAIKLEALPIPKVGKDGANEIWLSIFEKKPEEQQEKRQPSREYKHDNPTYGTPPPRQAPAKPLPPSQMETPGDDQIPF